MATLTEILRTAPWARALTEEQLQRVTAEVNEHTFAPGATVCQEGAVVDSWTGVLEGLVKLHTVFPDGRSVTFTGVPTGGWFGEGSLLKAERRKYGALALRESRIARMPKSTFEWLLDNSIEFNRFVLLQINERLGQFIALVGFGRLLDTDARIARCLGALFNPILYPGAGLRLSISQEEVGFLSGVSRQRANQALQKLEREGLLMVEYGGIRVLDWERLLTYGS
jgi:CRP/FNR family cyclic AMP-dependent transcriptional regulator